MNPNCRGLGVALATPFASDDTLDLGGLTELTRHVVEGGADFLVALGSTGEAAMLSEAERDRVVETVKDAAGAVPVFVGTGAPSTAQAVAWTRRARDLGADGALVVVPPYTKPSQDGLVAHFAAVAAAVPQLPIMGYNVPSRATTNLQPATLARIWQLDNVVAFKDSSGNLEQICAIAAALPPDKLLLSGDDAFALPTIAVGGQGLVSVAGNVVPGKMRDLVQAALTGDLARARTLHNDLWPLFGALSADTNPVPVKTAIELLGIARGAVRLPLLGARPELRSRLASALASQREVHHG
ncbi:MAG: 4-hydroxy-tetrahydrodipicolinate synthase [Planctomycetes bacterium]|nr:4-hydroxy-tetrahydrodipicolinate synthase [Planctomycetota bacterium]